MVNSLLFRWEDSQALQHHCGFCERPLSHPGARASCFGTHSEPCHRFHQAMFMRNRAHMCAYCSTIDEAHYKRHHELVTQLRNIYESCGEVDWIIMPAEPGDPRRGRCANDYAADDLGPGEVQTSKRERKDAKCLARAASRARVVTQEEIRYVDSVLHSAEGVFNGEDASPANQEEMQLIEEHLRYNANVYNSHLSRHDLKRFAKLPDVDVDFEAEMERVLDTLRITELVKRNFKNRGLQGKDLKHFESLVEMFRNAVVEDLVLVKKDMMEIRMRRAGYLRYTNKTAYGIVEDRYTDKDWKTGERIMASSDDSSSLSSLSEDVTTPSELLLPEDRTLPLYSSSTGPDRRHLQHIHTRISGDDGLGQKVIEPYHTPLLPLIPNTPLRKSAVLQLKVIENKENGIPAGMTNRGWLRRGVGRQRPDQSLQNTEKITPRTPPPLTPSVESKEARSAIKLPWGKPQTIMQGTVTRNAAVDGEDFLVLKSRTTTTKFRSTRSDAPAVQPAIGDNSVVARSPERMITSELDADGTHPVVSQKKAKKAQREAKRKAKKSSDPGETSIPIAIDDVGLHELEKGRNSISLGGDISERNSHALEEVFPQSPVLPLRELISITQATAHIENIAEQEIGLEVSIASSDVIMPRTTHGKHDHWLRFSRAFIVDQLTIPLLQSFEGCAHGSSCRYESNGITDCPFHEPHCSCVDPLLNQCYLMHPGKELRTSGPYNRAHGEKMLAVYEQHELTKGRVMLVDDDLVQYFLDINSSQVKPDLASMPPRLLREHTEFLAGYDRGPLMKQELEFERLFLKNVSTRLPLSTSALQDIQRQHSGPKGSVQICYCRTEVPWTSSAVVGENSKGFVRCSYRKCEFGSMFHKRCVNKLGIDKVTRWYCTACEKQMKVLACKTLNMPYKDDDIVMAGAEEQLAERVVAKMFAKPSGAMKRFKSRLRELNTMGLRGDLEVEDVD